MNHLKIKPFLNGFFLLLFLLPSLTTFGQRTETMRYKNKSNHTLSILNENPDSIIDWNVTLRLVDFRLIQNENPFDGNEQFAGPFFLDVAIQKFLFNKKGLVSGRLSFTPIDSRAIEATDGFKKAHLSTELLYTHQLYAKTFTKKKGVTFSGYYTRNATVTVVDDVKRYRLRPHILQKRSFGIRGGFHRYQFSLDKIEKYNAIGYSNIYAGDLGMLILGISSIKTINMEYSSARFGHEKYFNLSTFYIDFLYAPFLNLYNMDFDNSGNSFSEKIDNSSLDIQRVGFRFGGYSKGPFARRKLGHIFYYEVGWLPSAVKEFYFSFGYGLVLGKFKV